MNYIYLNLLETGIAIVLVVILDLIIERIIAKRSSSQKKSKKTRLIVRNVLIICLAIFLAKIWIQGFGHFLAFIGFVSAALTIAQKENILNLTGGFIIMWRDAFSEGDYVSIKEYEGIVTNLGIFYFTLEEANWCDLSNRSGKIVKVPNSFISLYPFSIYSFENFILYSQKYVFKFDSDQEKLLSLISNLNQKVNDYVYKLSVDFKGDVLREYKRLISRGKFSEMEVKLKLQQKKPAGYVVNISGHLPCKYINDVNTLIETEVTEYIKNKGLVLEEA